MAARRSGLGRGINSLIPDKVKTDEYSAIENNAELPPVKNEENKEKKKEKETGNEKPAENESPLKKDETDSSAGIKSGELVETIKIALVEPNREQPRKNFSDDGIEELASSIAQYGVIQPLLVQKKDGYYEIIAGERRWRAAKKAGLKEIPVIVKNYSTEEAVEISLIENIQREDLNPIEEAMAYNRLIKDFKMTQEQVAEKVSKSRSAVANSLRLLRLPNVLMEKLVSGELSEGHARTLLSLPTEEVQLSIADKIVKDGLSVRETEKEVQNLLKDKKSGSTEKKKDQTLEAILGNLSGQLEALFGTKVAIKSGSRHKGKIEIEYYSDEELDRLVDLLRSVKMKEGGNE